MTAREREEELGCSGFLHPQWQRRALLCTQLPRPIWREHWECLREPRRSVTLSDNCFVLQMTKGPITNKVCYGLKCVPPNFIYRRPNPRTPHVALLGRGPLRGNHVKRGHEGGPYFNMTQVLQEIRTQTHTEERTCKNTGED